MKHFLIALTILIGAFASETFAQDSPENTKKILTQMFSLMDEQKFDEACALIDQSFVDHIPFPGQKPGVEGVKEVMKMFWTAFPDDRKSTRLNSSHRL